MAARGDGSGLLSREELSNIVTLTFSNQTKQEIENSVLENDMKLEIKVKVDFDWAQIF